MIIKVELIRCPVQTDALAYAVCSAAGTSALAACAAWTQFLLLYLGAATWPVLSHTHPLQQAVLQCRQPTRSTVNMWADSRIAMLL